MLALANIIRDISFESIIKTSLSSTLFKQRNNSGIE